MGNKTCAKNGTQVADLKNGQPQKRLDPFRWGIFEQIFKPGTLSRNTGWAVKPTPA